MLGRTIKEHQKTSFAAHPDVFENMYNSLIISEKKRKNNTIVISAKQQLTKDVCV
jgi:hypothetical protein